MLLTSADYEVYIPPRWHGTVYSTEELLDSYRKRFKVSPGFILKPFSYLLTCLLFHAQPDSTLLTFHALEPYEPELICCERCVVEITVLPAGQTLHTGTEIVVFLVKIYEVNTLITKELGTELNFFPSNHHYHVRIMNEGIDILYVDDKIYSGQVISGVSYQHQCVQNLLKKLQPLGVKSLSGQQLPDQLTNMCRKVDAAPKK